MPSRPAVLAIACALLLAGTSGFASSQTPHSMVLASTPDSIPAVKANGKITTPERPGLRVELLRSAGKQCGVEVEFLAMPWVRALALVKSGRIAGAFSSSFSEERAEYGVYPMANNKPDPSRAMKGYTYTLYVHTDSPLRWNGKTVTGADRHVIVERGSAAVELALKLDLKPVEVTGYQNLVPMLAAKRAPGMIGIESYVKTALALRPAWESQIQALSPPLEDKYGYVMFGRAYYTQHQALVECYWNALRDIRSKPTYRRLVESYNDGRFIE